MSLVAASLRGWMTLGWVGRWLQVMSAGGMEGAGVQSPASHGGEHRDLA